MNKCVNCGNEFVGKFCNECGTPVEQAPRAAAEPVASEKVVPKAAFRIVEHPASTRVAQNAFEANKAMQETPWENVSEPAEPEAYNVDEAEQEMSWESVSETSEPEAYDDDTAEQEMSWEDEAEPQLDEFDVVNANASAAASSDGLASKCVGISKKIEKFNNDKNGILAKIFRWLTPAAYVAFGLFILIFMACSPFSSGGFGALLGMTTTCYSLLEFEIVGAGVGALFLIIAAVGFIIVGGIRILLAVKAPYYRDKRITIVGIVLMFITFLMSCIMVGSINGTHIFKAGAGGALILTMSIFGALFMAADFVIRKLGLYSFLAPLEAEGKAGADKLTSDFAAKRGASVAKAEQREAQVAQFADESAQTQSVNDNQPMAAAPIIQCADEPLDKISDSCKRGAKHMRFWPAIGSMLMGVIIGIVAGLLIMMSQLGGGFSSDDFYMVLSSIFGIALIVPALVMFAIGFYRLKKAYSDSYEKHPLAFLLQLVAVTCALALNVVGLIFEEFNNEIWLAFTIVSAISYFSFAAFYLCVAYQLLVSKTYKRQAIIKSERSALRTNPEKMRKKHKVVAIVLLVLMVVGIVIPPLTTLSGAGGGALAKKYNAVDIGMQQYEVENYIGTPDEGSASAGICRYYSKNYLDIIREMEEIEDNASFDDLESAFEKLEKLEQKLSELVYSVLELRYNEDNYGDMIVVKVTLYANITGGDVSLDGVAKNEEISRNSVYTSSNGKMCYEVSTYNGCQEKSIINEIAVSGYDFDNVTENRLYGAIKTTFGTFKDYVDYDNVNTVVSDDVRIAKKSQYNPDFGKKIDYLDVQVLGKNFNENVVDIIDIMRDSIPHSYDYKPVAVMSGCQLPSQSVDASQYELPQKFKTLFDAVDLFDFSNYFSLNGKMYNYYGTGQTVYIKKSTSMSSTDIIIYKKADENGYYKISPVTTSAYLELGLGVLPEKACNVFINDNAGNKYATISIVDGAFGYNRINKIWLNFSKASNYNTVINSPSLRGVSEIAIPSDVVRTYASVLNRLGYSYYNKQTMNGVSYTIYSY